MVKGETVELAFVIIVALIYGPMVLLITAKRHAAATLKNGGREDPLT